MRKVTQVLKTMSELYDKKISDAAILLILADLSNYEEKDLLFSLGLCRNKLSRFPTLADIKNNLPDGHPTPNEAWAMLAKSESESCLWTEEMRKAYSVVMGLDDDIAARMAFLEKYSNLVAESRAFGRKAKYSVSLGTCKRHREEVVKRAIENGHLQESEATKYLPLRVHENFLAASMRLITHEK